MIDTAAGPSEPGGVTNTTVSTHTLAGWISPSTSVNSANPPHSRSHEAQRSTSAAHASHAPQPSRATDSTSASAAPTRICTSRTVSAATKSPVTAASVPPEVGPLSGAMASGTGSHTAMGPVASSTSQATRSKGRTRAARSWSLRTEPQYSPDRKSAAST